MNNIKKLSLVICILFIACQPKVRTEVYLIPDNFIGNVIILNNQSNGIHDSIVDDKVIYKVPKNGFLCIKGETLNQNLDDMEYYYYNSRNNKLKLCRMEFDTIRNCKAIIYNNREESYGWSSDPNQLIYSIIIVGRSDSIPPDFDPRTYPFFNDLKKRLIKSLDKSQIK